MRGAAGCDIWGQVRASPLISELTCWVCRNIQDGLQQLHVLDVVNVNGLLQAHQQPLQSHILISPLGRFLQKDPTGQTLLILPVSPNLLLSLKEDEF